MLDADHPIEPDFEFIRYSQGTVRHRFFPFGAEENQELTPAQTSVWFIIGQAAKLVSATNAAANSSHPAYVTAQKSRADQAREALNKVRDIPAVEALLSDPSDANGTKLAQALEGMDLTAKIDPLLPDKSSYK